MGCRALINPTIFENFIFFKFRIAWLKIYQGDESFKEFEKIKSVKTFSNLKRFQALRKFFDLKKFQG